MHTQVTEQKVSFLILLTLTLIPHSLAWLHFCLNVDRLTFDWILNRDTDTISRKIYKGMEGNSLSQFYRRETQKT